MEEGSFRCDANVSLKPKGEKTLGTRCEIKNLNSFKNIERAIAYEAERQAEILSGGGKVVQETRLFDADSGRTAAMRGKEDSHDYRYFPDPDLKPLKLTPERIARLEKALPELPDAMEKRFKEALGLSEKDAQLLTQDQGLCAIFLDVTRAGDVDAKQAANWLTGEYLAEANAKNWDLGEPPVTGRHLHELLLLLKDGTISGKIAKTVFAEMAANPDSPRAIVEKKGLLQVSDEGAIKALVEKVLDANASQVAGYLKGNEKLMGFFVGQIMRESQGKMNPGLVNRILEERLDARKT
jgi:aspartyl-tRNA(Asn)/glutamyl-tRNA(Gln) amidotransferase subunit B